MSYHHIRSGPFSPSVATLMITLAFVAVLAGCSGGNVDIVVRDAAFTWDGPVAGGTVYQPGDNATLQLTIVNEADRADRLVRVTSPIAGSATITGDARIPGHQVLTAGYQNAPASTALPADANGVRIVLIGLRSPVRAGLSYPVVLAFERPANCTWNCRW